MTENFKNRITLLQKYLSHKGWDAFLVPRCDRYQGEYVVEADERLSWLTGFTGSAGIAIVMLNEVILLVDGRYILQAKQQVPDTVKIINSGELSILSCLKKYLITKCYYCL